MLQLLDRDVERQSRWRNILVTPARKLRAGGIEHPAADVDDQPALLRGRHEFAGLPHAVARRLPAKQCLHAGESPVGDGELRLIEEREFPAAQRHVQAGFRGDDRLRVHLWIEEHRATAAKVLGPVHCGIRVTHDIVDGRSIIGEQSDTDACAYEVIAAADVHRQLQ